MTLRVLHILPSIRGYGAERQIIELLPLLQAPELTTGLLTIYEPDPEERARLGFPVLSAGRRSRRDYFFLPRLVTAIRQFAPDVVHTHTHVGKYWGRVAAILAGVKAIVHTEHNPCDPRRNAFERIADRLLHRATSCTVTFFSEQRLFLAQYERAPIEKITVIPNGINMPDSPLNRDQARAALGAGANEFAIVVVGRMEFQKNHRLALETLAALHEETRRGVVLHFLGTGVEEPFLRGRARSLDIESHVRFHGFRNDVRTVLQGADLLLMTSWFEGMPLTLVEAMIAGVPIVTTPWTGARSMLGDGLYGFMATGWEAETVASELERAVALPGARAAIAARAREYVRRQYGLDRMAVAHRNLYTTLTRGSAA